MKNINLFIVLLVMLFAKLTTAQVTVNINVGTPPQWGPVGYTDVRYYYLPDVESYYDVQTAMFIYYYGGAWVHRGHLPGHYKNYDLYNGYKVVMSDYHGNSPYVHFNQHKIKYKKGYKGPYQKTHGNKPNGGKSVNPSNNGNNNSSHKSNNNGKKSEGNGGNNKGNKSHGGGKGKK